MDLSWRTLINSEILESTSGLLEDQPDRQKAVSPLLLGFRHLAGTKNGSAFCLVGSREKFRESLGRLTRPRRSSRDLIGTENWSRFRVMTNRINEAFNRTFSEAAAYSSWADSYDRDLARLHYQAPTIVANLANQYCEAETAMDLGCGTGLVVEAFRRCSGSNVIFDGLDQSPEMLELADRKRFYRKLICGSLSGGLIPETRYALVSACGLFASTDDRESTGDPDASCLEFVFDFLAPFGIFIFSLSERVWLMDRGRYEEVLARLPWSPLLHKEGAYHDLIPKGHYFVLRRIG